MGEAAADLARGQGRLLMVDDEPFLREAVATSLRFMGYEVTTAPGGDEALRLARACPFDLILLDVTLPDTDGFEVLRRLRRDGSQVPVLFLTARDTAADRATGLALGGDYLTKPFGLAELADRIAARLSRPDGPAPGPAPARQPTAPGRPPRPCGSR
ncbi:MAG: response regulator transcription factor [Streptosporangiaceae bacterium]